MTSHQNAFSSTKLHPDFYAAKKLIYEPCGFHISELRNENESQEYAACQFKLNDKRIVFRASKITPTKTGQFVTLWKRNSQGITEPFDAKDDLDFVIISSRSEKHFGQFIFPKTVLIAQGILSSATKNGKRGIRVYPPWDQATNKQAQKTQRWQVNYFLPIKEDDSTDLRLAKVLFGL